MIEIALGHLAERGSFPAEYMHQNQAEGFIADGKIDLAIVGQTSTDTPNLVATLLDDLRLAIFNESFFYGSGTVGHVNYQPQRVR